MITTQQAQKRRSPRPSQVGHLAPLHFIVQKIVQKK